MINALISVSGTSMGSLTGFALNSARDFDSKLLAYLAGWSKVTFSSARDSPYFLVSIFCQMISKSLDTFS